MSEPKFSRLTDALEHYQIEVTSEQAEKLDQYCQLVWEWNEKLNLTRHTDYEKFVSRDMVDSIELAKLLGENEEVLDVGTGGGVPGIVLAIIRPDLQISLAESVGKKATALNEMLSDLNLPITLFHARAEHLFEDFRFDALVARAVGPLWKICFWLKDDWVSVGRLLAIKGPSWIEERAEARHRGLMNHVQLRCVSKYTHPDNESNSVILKIWPSEGLEKFGIKEQV